MRLKKLDIYGFKSFADREHMVFDDGITGVVGPNGSGKSNISDAVRWVLGEQSPKTLRGAKMEDIIFGGTDKRKAHNYCEVSLTFDNADHTLPIDYNEVMVTRRVYRSGESEYCLNKTACRLKDIVDLFRDTGIGKEGYSLIGQGRIDEILSVKSEDRRNVFEEAAGITKYKARRVESERRMENTNQNLDRVEDILREVGARLPALEKQAQDARAYSKLISETRGLEANAFLLDHDRLEGDIAASQAHLEQALANQDELTARKEALSSQAEQKQNAVAALDQALTTLGDEVVSLTRQAQIHKGEQDVLLQRISSAKEDLARLAREAEADQRASANAGDLLARELANEKSLLEEQQQIDAALAAMDKQRQEKEALVLALEKRAEDAKEAMIASFTRLSDVKSISARLTATKESILKQGSALEQALAKAQALLEEATGREMQQQAVMAECNSRLAALKQDVARESVAREEALKTLAQSEKERQRVEGALREAQSRLKMLEQMRRDYDGYQNAVREILRRFDRDPAVYGVVASLLTLPRELERAVDMALGGAMQNIVCEREEDAKRMIDTLRAEHLGRATFLPLSAVRGRVLNQEERQVLTMPGCLGVASELIHFDEKYRPIFENLLGRTVIAETLDAGIAIMRKGRHAFRLVTLEGDVMHSGGSMTGGSVQSRSTSLLSREREIQEYRQAVAKLETRLAEVLAAVKQAQAQEQERAAAKDALESALHENQLEHTRCTSALEIAAEAKLSAQEQLKALDLEKERMADSLRQIEEDFAKLHDDTQTAQQTSASTQQDISRFNEETRLAREALEALRDEIGGEQAKKAVLDARLDASRKERGRAGSTAEQLRRAADIRKKAETALLARISADEQALQAAKDAQDEANQGLEIKVVEQGERRDQRAALQNDYKEAMEKLQQAQTDWDAQQTLAHKLEMRVGKATDELHALQNRLWERYELTYESAAALRSDPFDLSQARKRIEEIRAALRELGTVNLSAIDDYEEDSARFNELTTQKKDLEKARADLENIIKELTREMEERFLSQFQIINKNFTYTFSRLFGGGTAMVKLQDDTDCLNCGIDIVAQPPGKKLQLLSLLSGGERALTAIALLFSMLSIRPSPFCILDEIEAALDENNVVGFAEYLREYANNTQFIVITHRKGTMERCNSLYGVAMEEKGVSRMVSVRLSEIDQFTSEDKP